MTMAIYLRESETGFFLDFGGEIRLQGRLWKLSKI